MKSNYLVAVSHMRTPIPVIRSGGFLLRVSHIEGFGESTHRPGFWVWGLREAQSDYTQVLELVKCYFRDQGKSDSSSTGEVSVPPA